MLNKPLFCYLLLTAILFLPSKYCAAELEHFQHSVKADGSLSFLVCWRLGEERTLQSISSCISDIADFYFVDTTPFVDKYFADPDPQDHTYDWRGVIRREVYLSNLLKDIEAAVKNSTSRWKIVVGHHGIKSAGHHGATEELAIHLLPILEANGVDIYMNGHDHCLEHIISTDSKIHFLISGGGSKAWRGDVKWWNPEELKLYYDGQGFMSVQMTQTEANIKFYDVSGNVLNKWNVSKELHLAAYMVRADY